MTGRAQKHVASDKGCGLARCNLFVVRIYEYLMHTEKISTRYIILSNLIMRLSLCRKYFNRCRYTGCLLGLGHRPYDWGRGTRTGGDPTVKQVAFHPDHDMEVQLDVSFDHEDLHKINKVSQRLVFNSLG
jgi:hypothetical protein